MTEIKDRIPEPDSPQEGGGANEGEIGGTGKPPRIFLVLALVMILLAIAAYVYEDVLFDITYDSSLFVAALVIPVVLALFFLYAYSSPSLRRKMAGKGGSTIRRSRTSGGPSYNVFSGETVGDVKAIHGHRKSARHLRKKLARNTPKPGAATRKEDENPDQEPDEA